ncbi:MAG: M67 family metallopeptidase [Planctomycetes bacterium]|nr:M67 family metallopeptidase [Planctomycetota bacterium]
MTQLTIPSAIAARMVEQAREGLPLEVCGILAGSKEAVASHYEMTNSDRSALHYTMVPEEQFKVLKRIRAAGEEMLAIYHSHPATPARPSAEDIRLALTPGVIYVILSLVEPESPVIKGFTIDDEKVEEVTIVISNQ